MKRFLDITCLLFCTMFTLSFGNTDKRNEKQFWRTDLKVSTAEGNQPPKIIEIKDNEENDMHIVPAYLHSNHNKQYGLPNKHKSPKLNPFVQNAIGFLPGVSSQLLPDIGPSPPFLGQPPRLAGQFPPNMGGVGSILPFQDAYMSASQIGMLLGRPDLRLPGNFNPLVNKLPNFIGNGGGLLNSANNGLGDNCSYYCHSPVGGAFYCCRQGYCPSVRPRCPKANTSFAQPISCILDTDCPAAEKCCYDRCVDGTVCKKPEGL